MAEHDATMHDGENVGAMLSRIRQEQGLTLEDVCVALKLTSARVTAIEAEQFASVGAAIYVRGFVRSYAKLLGLPERGFDAQLQSYFDRLEPELVPSHGTRRSVNWGERYSWAFSYLVGTALVLTLIWTVIGFDNDNQKRALAPQETLESVETSAERVAAQAGEAESSPELPVAAASESLIAQPAYANPTVPRSPEQAPVLASLTPFRNDAATAGAFVLNLSAQSWTEITDATGRRVAYGILNGVHSIEGEAPFVVLLGNAGAAQLSVGGQALDIAPFMRANVARFKLEASNGVLQPSAVATLR
jgi:cytoskeleton protein RodZ